MNSLSCITCSPSDKRIVWNKPIPSVRKPEQHIVKEKTRSRVTSRSPSHEQFYTEVTLRNKQTIYLHYIDVDGHYWYLCQDILPYVERIEDSNELKRFLRGSVQSEDQQTNGGNTYIRFEAYCSIVDSQLQKGISQASFEDFASIVDLCFQMKKMIRERDRNTMSFNHPLELFGDLGFD